MTPHEADLGAWRALLDACAHTSAAQGRPRPTETELAHRLCEEGGWMRGCAEAAWQDDPLLDASPEAEPPEDGPVANALRLLQDRGSSPRCHRVARAIWHAARAARALTHTTADTADSAAADTARAALWCDAAQRAEHDEDAAPHHLERVTDTAFRADHPGLPWHLADALVARCAHGPQPTYESVAAKVLTGVGDALEPVATLILDLVPDDDERVVPDPDTMLYTLGLESLTPSLTKAFSWARGQDHFPRGHGLRWRLDGPHGPLPLIPDNIEVAGAAAVALARAMHHRRAGVFTPTGEHPKDADRRVIIHAGIEPPNRLLATHTPLDTLQRAVAAGHVLLLAPTEAAHVRTSAQPSPPQQQLKEAADIRQAVRRSRKVPRRLVAAVCALIAAATGLGVALGVTAQHRADRTRVSTQAAQLATSATDQQTRTPDQALVDALTAHALAPGTAGTHRALLSATDREVNRERVIRTGVKGLRAPALSDDGRYAAAIDSRGRPHLWRTADATPLPVPPDLTDVAALAFPAGSGPLALATRHGLAQWDPAAATPRWRTHTAATLVTYSRDGAHVASADSHGTIEVRDTQPGGTVHSTRPTQGTATALAFSADGHVLAIGLPKDLNLWTWRTAPNPEHTATGITTAVSSLTYADPCHCFYAVAGGRLHALSSTTAQALRKPISVALGMTAVYSPHQELLYLATANAVLGLSPAIKDGIADEDGGLGSRRDLLAVANNARGQLAANASGTRMITPSSSGGLIIYHLTDDLSHQYMFGVQRVYPLPASHSLLMVAGAYGNAFAGVFDPRTRKGTDAFARMGRTSSQQATDFDPRHLLLAVASSDGHVRLRHVDAAAQTFGPETTLTGELNKQAKTVAFDPPRRTLYAGWAHEIRVYDTTHPTRPRYTYRIGLPTNELILAVSPATAHATLFVATNRALYALPSRSGHFDWAHRTLLASGAFIQAHARPDGSVIAGTVNGALSLYRPQDASWSELPLDHLVGSVPFTIASYGDDIIVTSAEHASVFDARTGALTVNVTLPGLLPTAQSDEGSSVRLYDDTSSVTLPLDDSALTARACALLGKSAPATVADAWPKAPDSVRSRPLCRGTARSR